ncbi:MAG: pseudouridine synthase [Gammaproteobacteria bacterium]
MTSANNRAVSSRRVRNARRETNSAAPAKNPRDGGDSDGAARKLRRPKSEKAATAAKPAGEKLQKILASRGVASRRAAEQLIAQGRVTVNRKPAALGARAATRDNIAVDGKSLPRAAASRMLYYHKPAGKIVERGAPDSVFADLPPPGGGRWINVGRLDVGSEGLLLFCTDGEIANKIAHPGYGAPREYLARADGALSSAQIAEIRGGIVMDGGRLQPSEFAAHREGGGRNRWYRVVLTEGRNRAVRRLFAHFGLQTLRLIRLRMGRHILPRDLPPGRWREISPGD